MSFHGPRYQVGDAVFFRYVPYEKVDLDTGEVTLQTEEIPCTILSIAHSFDHDILAAEGVTLPRAFFNDYGAPVFFYYVKIDLEESAALGVTMSHPVSNLQIRTEVIREAQITGERIEF